MIQKIISFPFLVIIRLYQLMISPLFYSNCRHIPSCSHYSLEAYESYGAVKGSWLTLKRITRCHPWGSSGYDPVPERHDHFMRIAINEAKKGLGKTEENPAVGCIIVEKGKVVSKGFHSRSGGPHAECEALNHLGRNPLNATLYVTLEPCSTQGRTGACTDVILSKNIRHVVIGSIDPNPLHQGKGIRILRDHGLRVTTGILEKECEQLNSTYNDSMLKRA